jgi:hypothetical protein
MFREGTSVDVRHWPFAPWPERQRGEVQLEFRVIYDGKLPCASRSDTRNVDKDRIRRALSRQLEELFLTHPALKGYHDPDTTLDGLDAEAQERHRSWMKPGVVYTTLDIIAHKYERCGRRYVPLIDSRIGIACALDILFLRRDQPGNLIASGGDLDNRIKVLFDALRLPQNCDEALSSPTGAPDTEPIYTLLEDDRLIVEVKVTSDRLLTPKADTEHINDVRLIIHVKTVIIDSTKFGAITFG